MGKKSIRSRPLGRLQPYCELSIHASILLSHIVIAHNLCAWRVFLCAGAYINTDAHKRRFAFSFQPYFPILFLPVQDLISLVLGNTAQFHYLSSLWNKIGDGQSALCP